MFPYWKTALEHKLIFFPNPARGQVQIELGKSYNQVVAVIKNESASKSAGKFLKKTPAG
jgi:hypothetical protein